MTAELALRHLTRRAEILGLLDDLPGAVVATSAETRLLIETEELQGAGIGYVDAALLASARLTPSAALWTDDRRLRAVATRMGLVDPDRS